MWPNIRKAHTKVKRRKNSSGGTRKLNKLCEKKEALKCAEEAGESEKTRLKQKYREKKKAVNKGFAKAIYKKQQEWCDRIE